MRPVVALMIVSFMGTAETCHHVTQNHPAARHGHKSQESQEARRSVLVARAHVQHIRDQIDRLPSPLPGPEQENKATLTIRP